MKFVVVVVADEIKHVNGNRWKNNNEAMRVFVLADRAKDCGRHQVGIDNLLYQNLIW